MRFPSELIDVSEFIARAEKSVGKAEMQMAEQLIESMTTAWKPEQYTDEYRDALEHWIEGKIEHGDKAALAPSKKKRASNVVDLVAVLQESIQQRVRAPVVLLGSTSVGFHLQYFVVGGQYGLNWTAESRKETCV